MFGFLNPNMFFSEKGKSRKECYIEVSFKGCGKS